MRGVTRARPQAFSLGKEKQVSSYEVIGQVDTVALKASYGENWKGIRLTPPFRVYADSKAEALQIAESIIDPLHLCTMHITVEEEEEGEPGNSTALAWHHALASDDEGNLELTCGKCGTVVCNIESGDSLGVLADLAGAHWHENHQEISP